MAGVEAFCLLSGGTDQYGTSWPMYFEAWQFSQMSTLYSYLLIPFIKLLGLSKFSLRLPMLLMSLIALPLMWDAAHCGEKLCAGGDVSAGAESVAYCFEPLGA